MTQRIGPISGWHRRPSGTAHAWPAEWFNASRQYGPVIRHRADQSCRDDVDPVLKLKFETDRWITTINQVVLADFICEGHLGRHIRRTRRAYEERRDAFLDAASRRVGSALRMPAIDAGLATPAFYDLPIPSMELQEAAAAHGVEAPALARFTLDGRDIRGLLFGFAAFDAADIDGGMAMLAAALEPYLRKGRG